MDINEINILCKKCYFADKCPQDPLVDIIQCKNFKNIELQRDLLKIKKAKIIIKKHKL